MNRLAGILFFFGIIVFAFYLFTLSTGGETFRWMTLILLSPFGLFAQFAFLWIIAYRTLQTVQHLLWDAGYLFDLSRQQHFTRSILIAAVSLLLALCFFSLSWYAS